MTQLSSPRLSIWKPTHRVHYDNKCRKCGEYLEEGQEIVTSSNSVKHGKTKHWHRNCYTDAHGEPIL